MHPVETPFDPFSLSRSRRSLGGIAFLAGSDVTAAHNVHELNCVLACKLLCANERTDMRASTSSEQAE
jgi:hypothetical protein